MPVIKAIAGFSAIQQEKHATDQAPVKEPDPLILNGYAIHLLAVITSFWRESHRGIPYSLCRRLRCCL